MCTHVHVCGCKKTTHPPLFPLLRQILTILELANYARLAASRVSTS